MTTIKITAAFAILLQQVGQNGWVIINDDYAVGAYKSRAEARKAKADEKLAGTVVKASEIKWEVIEAAPKKAAKVVKEKEVCPTTLDKCPKCGSEEIYVGRTDPKTGFVIDEETTGGCHHCDWEYNVGILRESTIKSPCYVVWCLADEMTGARRKDVIAAAVAKGVAFYTARTQYQLWLSSKNGTLK